ncbi:MAG: recombinase family protein [Gemmataceae bacterium]
MKTAEPSTVNAFRPPNVAASRTNSSKVSSAHVEKLAIVYVRQSSPTQVLEHRESTARQYAFAEQAIAFGWPRERVLTIDEDLGKSGRSAEGRSGFQRLIAEVTLNHVGLVLGLELSRLARSSKDWHAFFEMCAVFGTLIADEDGVYDGNDPNDRLLLGLKGIMSEMELHIMQPPGARPRLQGRAGRVVLQRADGIRDLADRGVEFDPDEQAQGVMRLIFDKFDELGTASAVFRWMVRNGIRLPIRPQSGARKGQLDWRPPCIATLAEVLHHPIYAGAYSFGRRLADPKQRFSSKRQYPGRLPFEQWRVLLKDRLPAYITWDRYLTNQERMKQNRNQFDCRALRVRESTLLGGLWSAAPAADECRCFIMLTARPSTPAAPNTSAPPRRVARAGSTGRRWLGRPASSVSD